ncbi:HET-domain-containing protein, partial [Cryphonectria parasitica EP155]
MTAATPSRWHKPSCISPTVVMENNNTPRCTACHAAPDLEKICAVSEQHTPSRRDADANSGKENVQEATTDLNLRWPSSVRFVRPQSLSSPSTASPQPSSTQPSDGLPPSIHSLIYGQRLAPNQFRLACLTPTTNPSHPVHLNLETYEDDNCPEYETASYTWAGEDGDSTACCPVFFGPYWDVSLHTKNCWELLRFARPTRGIRLIWIDALCINQADIPERNEQVQKMGSIFSNCTRVVVYLGPDIVENQAEGGRFPTRHRLHELPWHADQLSSSPLQPPARKSMQEVLSLRYFTRIWIIQELVLSPQAVIRIGHADFVADSRTPAISMKKIRPVLDGERAVMPWLHMVSQQSLRVTDTLEALSIVRYSQATDPRDRLFGILGLIRHDQPEGRLQFDYSLSDEQLWIGFFAHVLLVEKIFWFLEFARGHGDSIGKPSWVPRWESLEAWSE